MSSFDIATSMLNRYKDQFKTKYPVKYADMYDSNNINHWLFKDYWDELDWETKSIRHTNLPYNTHSTRTVILNMKSPKTMEFLQRYRNDMVFVMELKPMDQPSFGKAGLSMFLDLENDPLPSTSDEDTDNHPDGSDSTASTRGVR